METSELNNYLTLENTQKTIKAQYERNQAQLQLLRGKARQLLRPSTKEYQAINKKSMVDTIDFLLIVTKKFKLKSFQKSPNQRDRNFTRVKSRSLFFV